MKQNKRTLIGTAIVVLGLLLLAGWLGFRPPSAGQMDNRADHALENTPPPGAVHPQYRLDLGQPDEWFAAGAKGETYVETLAGADLHIGEMSVYLGNSPPAGPYLPQYIVGRAYPGWDTSLLPDDAEILSVTLVLELPAGGGREEPLDITIYRGDWMPPVGLKHWLAPGSEAVGHWQLPASRIEEREKVRTGQGITLYAPEPARRVRVSLDPGVIRLDGVTRLELRHARESTLPVTAGVVSLGPSQIRLEVEYRP